MLDFSRLRTPPGDGDMLIEPPPDQLPALAEANRKLLQSYSFAVLDADVGELRARLRRSLGAECAAPVVLTGHQPEFIHAGVWANPPR